jgi:hypothetical protein
MTAPSVIRSSVGFRYCQILAIDSSGYPAASSTTVYEGVVLSGAKSLTINDPEPRQISHIGDDGIFALDVLPPTEPITGELQVAKTNDTLDAILTADKSVTIGEAKLFGEGTSNRGFENQVIMVASRQSEDTDPSSGYFGQRVWDARILPLTFIVPRDGSFDENPESRPYTVRPQFCTKYPWGVAFAAGTEGFVRAQMIRGIFEYKPLLVAWKGDNSATKFTFAATHQAVATAKIHGVWVNGVLDGAVVKATDGVTPTSKPGTGDMIVCLYETAAW